MELKKEVKFLIYCLFAINFSFFIYQTFFENNYIHLMIDERIIIDDIYNQWDFYDRFNRFGQVENLYIKNILVFITEFIYGGDLRYGRFWSNIYSFLLGPFVFLNSNILITVARILNILIYVIFVKTIFKFVEKKQKPIFLLISITILGSYYLLSIPKPDILAMLFSFLALDKFKKKDLKKSTIFFGMSVAIKLNTLFIFAPFLIYLLINNYRKFNKLVVYALRFVLGFIIVNPILLIPPISTRVPNFYLNYYNWMRSQAEQGTRVSFNYEYFNNWITSISETYFNLPKSIIIVFLVVLASLVAWTLLLSCKSRDHLLIFISSSGLISLVFILFFVGQNFPSYLYQPFILIFLSIAMNDRKEKLFKLTKNIFIVLIVCSGTIINISSINHNLNEPPNSVTINEVSEVLKYIDNSYDDKKNYFYKVAWLQQNNYFPRKDVTYFYDFNVLETSEVQVNSLIGTYDFYVTFNELKNMTSVNSKKIGQYRIYNLQK